MADGTVNFPLSHSDFLILLVLLSGPKTATQIEEEIPVVSVGEEIAKTTLSRQLKRLAGSPYLTLAKPVYRLTEAGRKALRVQGSKWDYMSRLVRDNR